LIIAIGDIHGCLDPLKALVYDVLALWKGRFARLEFLFIGDYIDRGPSVKEVLDFLLQLDAEKTFLMGNHEDMLLHYHLGSEVFEKYGNAWFASNNGGLQTVAQLDPSSPLPRLVREEIGFSSNSSYKFLKNNGEFNLSPEYEKFFLTLQFAAERTLHIADAPRKVLFSHSVPNPVIPLDKVVGCSSFQDFHALRKAYNIPADGTNLWNRDFLPEPFPGGYTIVHGHTPTFVIPEYIQRKRYFFHVPDREPFSEPPASEFVDYNREQCEAGGIFFSTNKQTQKLVQVDIDTGAVYGKRLSAVLFPENEEECRELSRGDIVSHYVDLASGYFPRAVRRNQEKPYYDQLAP